MPPPAIRAVRARRRAERHELWGLAFVLPVLVLFLVFRFWPMVQVIRLSFYRYDLLSPPSFVGLANYTRLWQDPLFHQSLLATTYYVLGTCLPLWVLSLALALLLDAIPLGKGIFRAAIFIPAIIPAVVLPILWRFLYHPYGLINSLLNSVGLPSLNWLSDTRSVIPAFILTSEWRFVPLFMVIYLAGLQSIPDEYQQAATVDGASAVQRFFTITLPLLRPTVLVVIVTSVVLTAKSLVLALLMTNGAPGGSSRLLSLFVYQNAFIFLKLGYASAASVVLLVVLAVFTLFQLRLFSTSE
jgi:ABC-type sugar transport system permease subunit